MRALQRLLAAALSAALVLVSPGVEAYAAAGNQSRGVAGALPGAAPIPALRLVQPGGALSPMTSNLGAGLPAIVIPDASGAGPAHAPTPALDGARSILPSFAVTAPDAAPTAAPSSIPGMIQAASEIVAGAAQSGGLQNASPTAAAEAGRDLQSVLTGELLSKDDSTPAARFGSLGDSFFFAKPAGDSIREANEANGVELQSDGPGVPTPPQNDGDGQGPAAPGPRVPFVAKVVSAAVALAPIAFVAWPLLAAGSTLVGSLVIAASLGYAAFPFMSESTPKSLRALPGVAVGLLGLAGAVLGAASGGLGTAAIGAAAAFGGWGFTRFARNSEKWKQLDEVEILTTMLGLLAAVVAVGLAAAPAAGVAAIVKIAAVPAMIPLLMHLPGWVGDAITNTVKTFYTAARQAHRVATSIRRDTSLLKRLTTYSEAAWEASSWHILWLGLLIWLPLLVGEVVQFVAGVSIGFMSGAVQAPLRAAWTLTHHFAKDSSLNKRLAFGARAASRLTSKAGHFNAWEKPFVRLANSDSFVARIAGALAIRTAQIVWLATSPLAALAAVLGAWAFAGAAASAPYDRLLHSPDHLDAPRDTAGNDVPDVDKPSGVPGSVAGRLLASAVGFAAFFLLTMPAAVGGGLLGGLLAITAVAVALMPLIPARRVPAWLARAPGDLLAMTGVYTALGAARYLLVGLPVAAPLAVGVLTLLAGLGLRNLVVKLTDGEKKTFDSDDWQYSLGYVGALGTLAALAVTVLAMPGALATAVFWAGAASSLALSAHLPEYLWKAAGDTFMSLFSSIGQTFAALGVWHRKTSFSENYRRWLGSMIRRWTIFGALVPGALLLPPLLAAYVVEAAASLALGSILGLYHAPGFYLWSAAHHKDPKSAATRFWAGFNTAVYGQLEGTRKTFLEPFVEKNRERTDSTGKWGRPSLRAYSGLILTALATTAWAARTAIAMLFTPLLLVWGVVKGVQRARRPAGEDPYENDPDRVFPG